MSITDYHAKYYAHELTKCSPSGDLEGIIPTLMSARVDLNPHQVSSALFAFKSPLSKGAILADEVGLGKTIEAGILLSQKWAERKRNLLVIVPASLRKQWNQELLEKFFLPSCILETSSFNKALKEDSLNPFEQKGKIVICSYQFVRNKSEYASQVSWDLIVIDEAHRLRNVYKSQSKIARAIKEAFSDRPKVLLTATPLQNSLMELYGLTSFVDEYVFGDQKSFKAQYASRIGLSSDQDLYDELKARLAPICKRSLRRQVQEYVKYTKRIPITQKFSPAPNEQLLYDNLSAYLQRDNLYALPASQKNLITLVLRKLLASSSYAIHGVLTKMITRLEAKLTEVSLKEKESSQTETSLSKDLESFEDTEVSLKEKESSQTETSLSKDFESFEDTKEEWGERAKDDETIKSSKEDKQAIKQEIDELKGFQQQAFSIKKDAKGQALLKALKLGFQKARKLGANEKVIIFTESRKIQYYLFELLIETEYAGKLVLFNGLNDDPISKQVYREWVEEHKDSHRVTGSRATDIRSALVDYFKETAQIMIATEAAAEGINLQFCSFVLNYDLPWNPQRIEQRIGRCHRYGQKHDVIVLNFLNENNAADQRVLDLLSEKFQLFRGVFGASDEVLGSIESGVDFEKRILQIYQKCRTDEEIQQAFDHLQEQMAEPISEKMKQTREKLIDNFDEEVIEKLKVDHKHSQEYLNKYEDWLWKMTKLALKDYAVFEDSGFSFRLKVKPFGLNDIPLGLYKMGGHVEDDAHIYRLNHPLAEKLIETVLQKKITKNRLVFYYNSSKKIISILENLIGKSGLLRLTKITVESLESEDHLIFSALTDKGEELDQEQCQRLFSLPVKIFDCKYFESDDSYSYLGKQLQSIYQQQRKKVISDISERNAENFDKEMDKLEAWAEDRKKTLEQKLKEMDKEMRELKRASRKASSLPEKLKLRKQATDMESKRDREWKTYDRAKKEIEDKKDQLITSVEDRLKEEAKEDIVFEIEWEVTAQN